MAKQAKGSVTPHELIGQLIQGEVAAKNKLVKMGKEAAGPLLDAYAGMHGRTRGAEEALFDTLKKVARNDVGAFTDLLDGHHSRGLVLFLIGHGSVKKGRSVPKASKVIKKHAKHRDPVLRAMALHHSKDGAARSKKTRSSKK